MRYLAAILLMAAAAEAQVVDPRCVSDAAYVMTHVQECVGSPAPGVGPISPAPTIVEVTAAAAQCVSALSDARDQFNACSAAYQAERELRLSYCRQIFGKNSKKCR